MPGAVCEFSQTIIRIKNNNNNNIFTESTTWVNEVEDTTAAVLMVDKYGGKDTPGNMVVNTRPPTHAL